MMRFAVAVTFVLLLVFCIVAPRYAMAEQVRLLPLSGAIGVPSLAAGSDIACGGGTYALTRSADLRSITMAEVEGFQAGDEVFSGRGIFPPGAVPIDPQRGSFKVYFPGREPGQEIMVSGQFALGPEYDPAFALAFVSFSVAPSMCAQLGLGPPLPGGGGLPDTGIGGPQGDTRPSWLLALAIGGVTVPACAFAGLLTVGRSRR